MQMYVWEEDWFETETERDCFCKPRTPQMIVVCQLRRQRSPKVQEAAAGGNCLFLIGNRKLVAPGAKTRAARLRPSCSNEKAISKISRHEGFLGYRYLILCHASVGYPVISPVDVLNLLLDEHVIARPKSYTQRCPKYHSSTGQTYSII
jgi:hypothetical protein